MTDVAALFSKLNINSADNEADFNGLVSKIKADPKLIAPTVAKLAEQVFSL
jgi:hypothetical protein